MRKGRKPAPRADDVRLVVEALEKLSQSAHLTLDMNPEGQGVDSIRFIAQGERDAYVNASRLIRLLVLHEST